MKKLLGLAMASFAFLAVVSTVEACGGHHCRPTMPDMVSIMNRVRLHQHVNTSSNTGYNNVRFASVSGDAVSTGDAVAALEAANGINIVDIGDCDCYDMTTIMNKARVSQTLNTHANSGRNLVSHASVAGSAIDTGDATAGSVVDNVINSVMIGVGN